ncbi:uncharacterized protein ISCGN_019366 [Ixodes scapularis]
MRRLELEFELRRLQVESEERIALRRIQLESEGAIRSSTGSRVGGQGPVDPLVQCSKVLKGHRLPCDADVPIWFDEVEKMFLTYRVPDEARVHLIMPALTERVRYLLRNLELEDCADYEQLKRAVLDELQLTPLEYRERFDSTSKRKDENWTQFASRVRTYLSYYLRAREAESKETMLELLVAERLKASLSPDRLEYVLLREGETWLRAHEIAKVLQTYDQAKGTKRDARGCEITVVRESLLPTGVKEPSGTVKLVSAFGQTIVAKLARVPIRLRSDVTGVDGLDTSVSFFTKMKTSVRWTMRPERDQPPLAAKISPPRGWPICTRTPGRRLQKCSRNMKHCLTGHQVERAWENTGLSWRKASTLRKCILTGYRNY